MREAVEEIKERLNRVRVAEKALVPIHLVRLLQAALEAVQLGRQRQRQLLERVNERLRRTQQRGRRGDAHVGHRTLRVRRHEDGGSVQQARRLQRGGVDIAE